MIKKGNISAWTPFFTIHRSTTFFQFHAIWSFSPGGQSSSRVPMLLVFLNPRQRLVLWRAILYRDGGAVLCISNNCLSSLGTLGILSEVGRLLSRSTSRIKSEDSRSTSTVSLLDKTLSAGLSKSRKSGFCPLLLRTSTVALASASWIAIEWLATCVKYRKHMKNDMLIIVH